ncbi:MAG: hypothetical protein IJ184_06230 [Alphaproteobacteria bacterium]|nr:hypothetical protein [Alphaproteobacteria bacterium]
MEKRTLVLSYHQVDKASSLNVSKSLVEDTNQLKVVSARERLVSLLGQQKLGVMLKYADRGDAAPLISAIISVIDNWIKQTAFVQNRICVLVFDVYLRDYIPMSSMKSFDEVLVEIVDNDADQPIDELIAMTNQKFGNMPNFQKGYSQEKDPARIAQDIRRDILA